MQGQTQPRLTTISSDVAAFDSGLVPRKKEVCFDVQARSALAEQGWLTARRDFQTELLKTQFRGYAALRGAFEIAFHDQVRFINFLKRVGLFAHSDGQRTDPDRTAAELRDDRFEDAL